MFVGHILFLYLIINLFFRFKKLSTKKLDKNSNSFERFLAIIWLLTHFFFPIATFQPLGRNKSRQNKIPSCVFIFRNFIFLSLSFSLSVTRVAYTEEGREEGWKEGRGKVRGWGLCTVVTLAQHRTGSRSRFLRRFRSGLTRSLSKVKSELGPT